MRIRSNIFITLITLLAIGIAQAQEAIPDACAGTVVRYGVEDGLPNSVFEWTVTGGTIIGNYKDSVDVQWGNQKGTFSIQVIEHSEFDCTADPYLANVQVYAPYVELGTDIHLCEGETQFVNAGNNFVSYKWSNGSQLGSSIPVSDSGLVWVEVMDQNFCTNRDSLTVYLHQLPEIDLGEDIEMCGGQIDLNAGNNGLSYQWYSGGQKITYNGNDQYLTVEPGVQTYAVQVEDRWGCANSDTINILACLPYEEFKKGIPTAFTPNGDQFNDEFLIPGMERYPNMEVEVFDRWGRRIFKSDKGYTQPWDGTFNGNDMPADAYYYIINVNEDNLEPIAGSISIMR
jgi:gliding motility-associated-like protein